MCVWRFFDFKGIKLIYDLETYCVIKNWKMFENWDSRKCGNKFNNFQNNFNVLVKKWFYDLEILTYFDV